LTGWTSRNEHFTFREILNALFDVRHQSVKLEIARPVAPRLAEIARLLHRISYSFTYFAQATSDQRFRTDQQPDNTAAMGIDITGPSLLVSPMKCTTAESRDRRSAESRNRKIANSLQTTP
jgi:hypothetical protein